MGLTAGIALRNLESIQGGMAHFYTPQSSNETKLVQVPSGTIDELFVHRFQTDQLLVVRGSFILVALQNKHYHYIPLSEHKPQVITIPPGVPHGAINLSSKDCLVVNAVLRHGAAHPLDYRPMKPPFPYDFDKVNGLLETLRPLESEEKEAVLFS